MSSPGPFNPSTLDVSTLNTAHTKLTHSLTAVAASDSERERRRSFFKPAFERLVTLIRGRLRYPESWSSWSKEEHIDFKRQR